MKVAVSIPETVFAAAERIAKQHRMPRSYKLFAEALSAYVQQLLTARIQVLSERIVNRTDQGLSLIPDNALRANDGGSITILEEKRHR